MEPVFYVIALMGCGDGAVQCREARVEPTRYESAVQCRVAMEPALRRNTDLPFPVITAACQQRGVRWVKTDPTRRGG